MNFEEHAAKPLLSEAGIAVPDGGLAESPAEAGRIAARLGAVVVKAQVPTGKRGKAGGIRPADDAAQASAAAQAILGMAIGEHRVERVLVEQRAAIARELYAAVLSDPASKGPLLLFCAEGGMEIEQLAAAHPDKMLRLAVDVRRGPSPATLRDALAKLGLAALSDPVAELLGKLYRVYAQNDAELVEINPLAVTEDGGLVALDCKFSLEDSGAVRHGALAGKASPELYTPLEDKAREHGLKFIELDGDVGILANGAGLTMTSMDAVSHYGGRPANFLEIGGEAYTLGKPALEVVLSNPRVKSLLVNFCGAFARTDVMTAGILEAWDEVKPSVPVFFTIHGTGEAEAIAMVRGKLGIEPFDVMDDAVQAAVAAAR